MKIEDFNELAGKLEPGAAAGSGDREPYLFSIAVSLKRLADAAERLEKRQAEPPATP